MNFYTNFFKADNRIDKQRNSHEFSDCTKIKDNSEAVCIETNLSPMFNLIFYTFLNIFKAIIPVT